MISIVIYDYQILDFYNIFYINSLILCKMKMHTLIILLDNFQNINY